MTNLNKTEFTQMIAKENGISKAEAERNLKMVIDAVEKALSKGHKISLIGFGNFYITESKARTGKNPRTGEAIKIKASKQPRFKAGSKLKEACN